MTTTSPGTALTPESASTTRDSGGGTPVAVIATAGVLMVLTGIMHVLEGVLASFMWLPLYPIWSVIVFDAFVIWAVTAHGRAMLVEPDPGQGGRANH